MFVPGLLGHTPYEDELAQQVIDAELDYVASNYKDKEAARRYHKAAQELRYANPANPVLEENSGLDYY